MLNRILTYLLICLSAASLPSIIFISVPLEAIFDNKELFVFYRGDLFFMAEAFLIASSLIALVLILVGPKRRPLVVAVISGLCVGVFLSDAIVSRVWISTAVSLAGVALVEAALFIVVVLLALRAPANLALRALAVFALINGSFGVMQAFELKSLIILPAGAAEEQKAGDLELKTTASVGNVYHVVLDAFIGPYVQYLKDKGENLGLEGFTYFPNTTSQYGRTNLSMRSVFRGQVYSPNFEAWANDAFSEGFTRKLRKNGVALTFFPFYSYFCDPGAAVCRSTIDAYNSYNTDASRDFLIDTMFLRSLPASLRAVVSGSLGKKRPAADTWEYQFSFTDWLEGDEPATGGSMIGWPIQSFTMKTLTDFERSEPELPSSGRYTYLHVMIPHAPLAFDDDCTFVGENRAAKKGVRTALEDQQDCALHVVREISRLLKRLDRFDDSLIVVHSDHGLGSAGVCSWWKPDFSYDPTISMADRDTTRPSNLPTQQIACESSALLMVKFPQQHQFKISTDDRQLVDIAPTILDYFSIAHPEMTGVSLFKQPPENRTAAFYEATTDVIPQITEFGKFSFRDGIWSFEKTIPVTHASPDAGS